MKLNLIILISILVNSFMLMAQEGTTLNDPDISIAIENKLQDAPAIDASRIEVVTDLGIVRLKGNANNLLATRKAEDIALAIAGVRGVVNLLEVKPKLVSDEKIKERIEDQLTQPNAPTIENLRVIVADGKVQMSGVAHSWQEANLAGDVVASIYGVTQLDNNIDFEPKENRPDDQLEAEIEKMLKMNARIDGDLIEVEVNASEVKLSGVVGSAWEKKYAQKIAWVSGVNDVQAENLNVEKWARDEAFRQKKYEGMSADEQKQAIMDAFLYDPRVFSADINVSVEGGIATLTGEADNLKAKLAAGETANNIIGIWQLKNEIDVNPSENVTADSEISESLEEAYQWDAYLNEDMIDVTVYEDTVYLDGAVDNFFEKYLAEDIANRIQGVENVNNQLTVDDDYPIGYYNDWFPEDNAIPLEAGKTDQEIKEDIQTQYIWSPFVDADEIAVSVNKGQATLNGTVESYEEYRYAEKNAYEAGAIFVDNNLEVDIAIPER